MTEWHLPPDYIVTNWTDELLNLMIEKLTNRKKRINEGITGNQSTDMVSDQTLFRSLGKRMKVIKKN